MTADLGRLGAWGHLDSLPIDAARAYARRVDELGFGTLWVPETVGREPFTLLGLLAAETSSLMLGTSIVGIWGHDAQTTRMAAQTLQEATDGRFVLGLGVSHPHLAERLRGHTYDRPLTRMREFLAAYRAATYRGPMASGAKTPRPPPSTMARCANACWPSRRPMPTAPSHTSSPPSAWAGPGPCWMPPARIGARSWPSRCQRSSNPISTAHVKRRAPI